MTTPENSNLPAPESEETFEELEEESKHPHLHRYLIFGTLLLILLLFTFGYWPRHEQRLALNKEALEVEVPQVRTMRLQPDKKDIKLILPTSTDALRITPIWARTNGYLSKFLVDIGDHVKEGQLLATIDTPEIDQELYQARADLNSAIAKRDIARISSERWEELYKHNSEAISKQEVDERKATYDSAVADLLASQANVQRLEKIQGFQNVYAPFDGIIIQRDIDLGTLISAGSNGMPQELFKIAKTDIIRAFVNVPQNYFRMIYDGQEADMSIREFPNQLFSGIVARTSKSLDPIARTLLTEVHVENKSGKILVGLYAEVQFTLHPDTVLFIIPTDALIIRSGDPQVAILDDKQTVHLKTVTIAKDMGRNVEISDGLKEGDIIVVNPNEKIREGVRVEIQDKH